MQQLQLYIEGQEVEMFKDESVTLTRNITDVKKLDAVLTDYSRSFNVPASKNNNKIFKHFYNYYIDGYNSKIKKQADLHINYKPFRKGKIRFEGASLKNNKPDSYKLTFFGDSIKLTDVIGEDKISTLTELSVFDFAYNDTNLQAYMNNGLDGTIGTTSMTNAVIIPLITHTSRLIYDSSANQNNNVYPSLVSDNNGVLLSQLKPALRLDAIIKAIELHYDLEFSNHFFNSTNYAYFNLFMWLHTKSGGLFEDQKKSKQFKNYAFSGTSLDELNIRSNNFAISNRKKHIRFNLDFTVEPADTSISYNLVVHKNGEEFKRFDNLTGKTKNGTALGQSIDHIEVKNGQFAVFIETAAATNFDIDVRIERENNGLFGGKKDATLSSTITTITSANFSIAANLPEMKVIDFLQGLFKMFNLVAYATEEQIVVQTLDDYYASSNVIHDITSFVDSTKSQVDSPIPFRQVNLGYESTETFLAKSFKKINNRDWGKAEYTEDSYILTGSTKDKYEGETYEIELPFEHMLFERFTDAANGSLTNLQWGWHVDEKQSANSELPVLFYAVGHLGSISVRTLSGTKVTISTPYMPSNSQAIFSNYVQTGMSQSINFHAEVDEFAGVSNEKTLFKTYYEDYITDLFDERKRITKLSAELPLSITETLELNDDIKIFDKLYRINSITTNFENGKSELELTNILRSTEFASQVDTLTTPITVFGVPIDVSSIDITVDDTNISVDSVSTVGDGFTLPSIIDDTPAPILQNIISDNKIDTSEVTAATVNFVSAVGAINQIIFQFEITQGGSIGDQENVDEYGFLVADSEATLTASDDIDTLKTAAGVQLIHVNKDTIYLGAGSPLDLTASPRIKRAMVTALSHPTTKYVRFYVKTNTDPNFETANTITDVFSGRTDNGAGTNTSTRSEILYVNNAGFSSEGYSTIPTKAQIEANAYTTQTNSKCGDYTLNPQTWRHNGLERYPQVNDFVSQRSPAGVPNYSGGTSSFVAAYGQTAYFALSVGDHFDQYVLYGNRHRKVKQLIVVEYATAKVVAVYVCEEIKVFNNALHLTSFYLPLQAKNTQGRCLVDYNLSQNISYEIAHNGSGANPDVGDQIRFTKVHGIPVTTSFNNDQSNFSSNATAFNEIVGTGYDYHQFMLTDERFFVRAIITVQQSTAEVINTHYCE